MRFLRTIILPVALALAFASVSAREELSRLKKVKYLMINGNLLKAERQLEELELGTSGATWEPIQKRYLAILKILQGRFHEVENILSLDIFKQHDFYDRICPLKVISHIALQNKKQLEEEFDRCFFSRFDNEAGDLFWLSTLLKRRGLFALARERDQADRVSLWLKLAIYLDIKENVWEQLRFLPTSMYQYPRVRELVSMLYYRRGRGREALNLAQGVDLVNAHNIQGNLALVDGRHEEAYGHFKQGLKKKKDSLNSLYRLLPLAWLLQDFEPGYQTLRLIFNLTRVNTRGRILKAAFFTEMGRHQEAVESLLLIPKKEKKSYRGLIDELLGYNYFFLGRFKKALLSAYYSCSELDGLNCYLLTHLSRWDHWESRFRGAEDLKKLFAATSSFASSSGIELGTLWKEEVPLGPFQEEQIFVEQSEVERLDF